MESKYNWKRIYSDVDWEMFKNTKNNTFRIKDLMLGSHIDIEEEDYAEAKEMCELLLLHIEEVENEY